MDEKINWDFERKKNGIEVNQPKTPLCKHLISKYQNKIDGITQIVRSVKNQKLNSPLKDSMIPKLGNHPYIIK